MAIELHGLTAKVYSLMHSTPPKFDEAYKLILASVNKYKSWNFDEHILRAYDTFINNLRLMIDYGLLGGVHIRKEYQKLGSFSQVETKIENIKQFAGNALKFFGDGRFEKLDELKEAFNISDYKKAVTIIENFIAEHPKLRKELMVFDIDCQHYFGLLMNNVGTGLANHNSGSIPQYDGELERIEEIALKIRPKLAVVDIQI